MPDTDNDEVRVRFCVRTTAGLTGEGSDGSYGIGAHGAAQSIIWINFP
jgi:hypothetical protein